MCAKNHPHEAARLEALRAYDILDTPREGDFDDLVALAAQICGTPMSLVILVDEDRQWFKARVGVDASETGLDASVCAHAILGKGHFEVSDTMEDARTSDNPLVVGDFGLRFYAGVPLETPEGLPLGSLCVLDTVPRELTESQREALRVLGGQVMAQLELRRQARDLAAQRAEAERRRAESEAAAKFLTLVTDRLPVRIAYVDQEYRYRFVNDGYERELGLMREAVLGLTVAEVTGEAAFALARPRLDRALRGEANVDEMEAPYPSGSRHVRVAYVPDRDAKGDVLGVVCHIQDTTERRRAERLLEETRSRQDRTLERANVATFDWDVVRDRVTANPLLDLFFGTDGLSQGMPLGRYFDGINPEDIAAASAAIVRSVETGEPFETEYRVFGSDGRERWALARGDATTGADGTVTRLSGVVLDISQRVASEQALREAQARERARLNELLDKAPAFTAVLEGPDLTFTYANDDYLKLVGRRDVVGRPLREALPEVVGQGYFENLEQVMATGKPFTGDELPVALKREPEGPLEVRFVNLLYQAIVGPDGKVGGVFAHGVDVTTQVLARRELEIEQAKLRRSEERFRAAQETTPDPFTIIEPVRDDAGEVVDFRWAFANDATLRLTGETAQELVGALVSERRPGIRATELYRLWLRTLETGEPFSHEVSMEFPSGRAHLRLTSVMVHEGIATSFHDLTQRQLNQERLEEMVAERTQQLRTAVKEAEGFNYSISHDLRAPLRAIVSSASILLEEAWDRLDEGHRELLERQAFNANRLGKLIDELLRLSRLARVEVLRKPLDMTAKARSVAGGLETSCRVEVQEGLTASGDADLVRTILQNLIENACKFSPPEATIRVGGTDGAFWVRDEGIGFDMKFAPKIFLPFERLVTEDQFPGTGIGLANVERIVRRHGGRVWAESAPGEGATFFFTLNERASHPDAEP